MGNWRETFTLQTRHQARIGTEAPDDIAIVREELLEGLQSRINKASASSVDKTLARCWLLWRSILSNAQRRVATALCCLCYSDSSRDFLTLGCLRMKPPAGSLPRTSENDPEETFALRPMRWLAGAAKSRGESVDWAQTRLIRHPHQSSLIPLR